ncbi:penicillin-binding protein 2 [Selenomonas sp. TAMA-11512]|uniref:penicillin-binding protein 2 n=1 Tax=Selenomonas sp. TAMA-11512 TaxID=3095337 RepID=UPI00308DD131|nr:penicillin-binding protein 2 [Selenomonas sp. TAMA-11512]
MRKDKVPTQRVPIPEPEDDYTGRVRILGAIVTGIIIVLIVRLVYLQVYDGAYYARLADGNRIRIIPSVAPRGNFYDRNGEPLVVNRPSFTASLLPLSEPPTKETLSRLSVLLQVPAEEIQKKIDSHVGLDPIRIKQDLGPELVTILEEQRSLYPGVIVEVQPIRDYIYHTWGAHALGYVSEISEAELEAKKDQGYKSGDIIGKFGLERVYDTDVRGVNGGRQVEVDVTGKPVQNLGTQPPVAGADLELTIDARIQVAAERAIAQQLGAIGAHAAAAVVMNPQTGEVLALASNPSFDPNFFVNGISEKNWKAINENPYHPMDNKAITGEYPPGSTFKIVTGTAALEEGKVTPQEIIYDPGYHWLIPKTNAGGEALGAINFVQALAHSDNVYFYEMGYRLGVDLLEKYTRMFGVGEKTGIDLPYESEGLAPSKAYKKANYEDDWYISETFDAAIGQGFNLVTPLQAAMIMGQIASGGNRYKPHLVNRIRAADGHIIREFKPELLSKLDVRPEVIAVVRQGLEDVASYGTAAGQFGPNYPVKIASKTGTAENPHGRDHGWFVAYAPVENPTIVIAVVVEQGGFGSQSAVPIAKKILDAAFNLKTPETEAVMQEVAIRRKS